MNTINDFKIGSRVRLLDGGYDSKADPSLTPGGLGTVVEVNIENEWVAVFTDEGPRRNPPSSPGWTFYPEELELLQENDDAPGN